MSIDDILQAVYGAGRNSRLKLSDHEVVETWMSVDQAKKAILDICMRVIGENEPDTLVEELDDGSRIVQINPANELRTTQRQALQKELGV